MLRTARTGAEYNVYTTTFVPPETIRSLQRVDAKIKLRTIRYTKSPSCSPIQRLLHEELLSRFGDGAALCAPDIEQFHRDGRNRLGIIE